MAVVKAAGITHRRRASPVPALRAVASSDVRAAAVGTISTGAHRAFLRRQGSASFLQTPAWAAVKSQWRAESIGWEGGGQLRGAALVLYRRLPRLRRALAYLPEGPVIDWAADDLAEQLAGLVAHVKSQGAFAVRIGPLVACRVWEAPTVKKALADPGVRHLRQVEPDLELASGLRVCEVLRAARWRPPPDADGFGTGQPQHVFQIPLVGRDEQDLRAGMNQMWRRNIDRAAREGVEVSVGTRSDLADFHRVYVETARRDGFFPRPVSYFQQMYDALRADDSAAITLFLAHHAGDLVAATLGVQVGNHAWYAYGASTTHKREVRASHALQWRMLREALAAGAAVYDLRGITGTLEEDDPHVGLTRFKVGTGGRVVEYAGEWTLPISRPLTAAFDLYLRRRAGD